MADLTGQIRHWQINEYGVADIAGLIMALEGCIVSEIPIGVIDGINKIFTLSLPAVSDTMSVFLNGIKESDFTVDTTTQFTMANAPKNTGFTDKIEVIYTKKII